MDKKALILVADDNSECRKLLMWFLELHGFRTISATCGLEAVELAIEFQPRLVLMDLSMPGMNGFEATQAIHTHRRGREIPVVAVSSYCVDYGYRSGAFKDFIACGASSDSDEGPVPWQDCRKHTRGLALNVVTAQRGMVGKRRRSMP
jgi:CheY-like chemotaxis protein